MSEKTTGRCLCGAVRFEFDGAPGGIGFCHCKMCRRWSGGAPFAAFQAAPRLLAAESLRWHKSSEWGERGFCRECGTPLFWRAAGVSEWAISAGALDDEKGLAVAKHIFIDDKPDFYDFADDAPRSTGAEFTAGVLLDLSSRFGEDFLRDALAKTRAHHGDRFAGEVERLVAEARK